MKFSPVEILVPVLICMLPAPSRAQAGNLADEFFSGGYQAALAARAAEVPQPAAPAFDPAANKKLAEKLNIPVFFALPDSAYAPASRPVDGLLKFTHPGAAKAAAPTGLRVYITPHKNAAQRLAASGLVQTGDVILTFRPEWGFQGPYPNIQMGISHAGLAVVENGTVLNVENPLNAEYLGNMDSKHYREAAAVHVIRPRGLNAQQKANLSGWAKKLTASAQAIYPAQLSFNQDYFSPKYTADMKFVKTLARIALRQDKSVRIDLYCSEFVWALLALRDCEPGLPGVFAQEGVPACIKPVFMPLPMLGDHFSTSKAPMSRLGLSDGPLAVIDSMGLPEPEKQRLLHEVFVLRRAMSPGHTAVAQKLGPYFMNLEGYYAGIQTREPKAVQIMDSFNGNVKPNYSPTSFLVNTLLPAGSEERKLDVVGTVLFSD